MENQNEETKQNPNQTTSNETTQETREQDTTKVLRIKAGILNQYHRCKRLKLLILVVFIHFVTRARTCGYRIGQYCDQILTLFPESIRFERRKNFKVHAMSDDFEIAKDDYEVSKPFQVDIQQESECSLWQSQSSLSLQSMQASPP
jgi:hypothetical protein